MQKVQRRSALSMIIVFVVALAMTATAILFCTYSTKLNAQAAVAAQSQEVEETTDEESDEVMDAGLTYEGVTEAATSSDEAQQDEQVQQDDGKVVIEGDVEVTEYDGTEYVMNSAVSGSVTFYYAATSQGVTLEPGYYLFEVWGAAGADWNQAGGKGGYAKGVVKITRDTTVYAYVGAKGNGWNGGGGGKRTGGGGTDFRMLNRGADWGNYDSLLSRVIVAGGGGGDGHTDNIGGAGGGAYANGGTGDGAGGGATLTSGNFGSGSGGGTKDGLWGSSDYRGGCGGGGGWRGGSGGQAGYGNRPSGGGGGSGFVYSNYSSYDGGRPSGYNTHGFPLFSDPGMSNGVQNGNGQAKITVYNKDFNTRSNASRTAYRGDNVTIYPGNFASLKGGSNARGPLFYQSGYYLHNSSSLNSQDTTNFSYFTRNDGNITFSPQTLPNANAGTNGANYTRYVGVRAASNYGSRYDYYHTASLTVTVRDKTIGYKTANFMGASGSYPRYMVGNSTTKDKASETKQFDYGKLPNNASVIYNPNGTNIKTVFVPDTISSSAHQNDSGLSTAIRIDAQALATDGDTNFDEVRFNTASSASAATLSYESNNRYLILRPNSNSKTGYYTATIYVQSYEKKMNRYLGSSISYQLVYRVDGGRPTAKGPEVNLSLDGTGYSQTASISISDLVTTEATSLGATFATGTGDIKVPGNEYLSVDRYGTPQKTQVAMFNHGGSVVDAPTLYNSNGVMTKNGTTGTINTGEGSVATGFAIDQSSGNPVDPNTYIVSAGSSSTDAYVSYSISSTTITFTALRASDYKYTNAGRQGHFYVLVRLNLPDDSNDTGAWYPISLKVFSSVSKSPTTVANASMMPTGDAYIKYFSPISSMYEGSLYGVGATTVGGNASPDNSLPLAVNVSDTTYVTGNAVTSPQHVITLLSGTTDHTRFSVSGLNNDEELKKKCFTTTNTDQFYTVTLVPMYVARSVFSHLPQTTVAKLLADGYIFYVNESGAALPSDSGANASVYGIIGIKVEAHRSTLSQYFTFDVSLKNVNYDRDKQSYTTNFATGTADVTLPVYIKIGNTALTARNDAAESTGDGTGKINLVTNTYDVEQDQRVKNDDKGTIAVVSDMSPKEITYRLYMNETVTITPYDLASDIDTYSGINVTTGDSTAFNSNPVNAGYSSLVTEIGTTYAVNAATSLSANTTEKSIARDKLVFASTNILQNLVEGQSYVTLDAETGTIPTYKFTAKSRTPSTLPSFVVRISDEYNTVEVTIKFKVMNIAPQVKTYTDENGNTVKISDKHFKTTVSSNSSDGILEFEDNSSLKPINTTIYTDYQFEVSELANDLDTGDNNNLSFSGEVKVQTYDENGTLVDTYNGVPLSNYISATIDLGTGSKNGKNVLRVRGLSSTQQIKNGVYVSCTVSDNYGIDTGKIPIVLSFEVINSMPQFISSALTDAPAVNSKGEAIDNEGNVTDVTTDTATQDTSYTWQITPIATNDLKTERFIVNSQVVYDYLAVNAENEVAATAGSNVVSSGRKKLLFDDPDAMQNVKLAIDGYTQSNGSNIATAGLTQNVTKANSATDARPFVSDDLLSGTSGPVVAQSPAFYSTIDNDLYLTIRYYFFKLNDDKDGLVLTNNLDECKSTEYWAIGLSYEGNSTAMYSGGAQIKLKVSDCENNADTYSEKRDSTTEPDTTKGRTSKIVTFYYEVLPMGIIDNHETYRTLDAKTELNTKTAEYGTPDTKQYYMLMNDNLYDYQFTGGKKPEQGAADYANALSDNFKYQYFVYAVGEGNVLTKVYPSTSGNAFYYKPIEVDSINAIDVPLSYFAMPQSLGEGGTSNKDQPHVSFMSKDILTENDKSYDLSDVKLSDGTNVWSGSDIANNPYLDIAYKSGGIDISDGYVNANFAETTPAENGFTYAQMSFEDGSISENTYGFEISKKNTRPTGTLYLTVNVKLYGSTEVVTKSVTVEVNVANSELSNVKDTSLTLTSGGAANGVALTNNNADLNDDGNPDDGASNLYPVGVITIATSDSDTHDRAKFYLPSISGYDSVAADSASVAAYLEGYYASRGNSTNQFYGKGYTFETGEDPNPGYENFFTITTERGISEYIQFTPVNKTDINNADATTLTSLNLIQDNDGIYYPFKVIVYDECGSGIESGNGSFVVLTIKVYVKNSAISTTSYVTQVKDGTSTTYNYALSLAPNAESKVSVTQLVTDNDIAVVGDVLEQYPSWNDNNTANYKNFHDYLMFGEYDGSFTTRSTIGIATSSVGGLKIEDVLGVTSEDNSDLIKFTANRRFKGSITYAVKFYDMGTDATGAKKSNASVTINFILTTTNTAPTVNASISSASIDLTMRTGDSFTVLASDPTLVDDDTKGGFTSPASIKSATWFNGSHYDSTTGNDNYKQAADYATAFEKDTVTDSKEANFDMGTLVLATDDAPSQLRISGAAISGADNAYVTATELYSLAYESGSSAVSKPLGYTIKVNGVCNANYIFTVTDGEYDIMVTVNITVVSTAPTVKQSSIGNTVTFDTDTYTVVDGIAYGESLDIKLQDLAQDIDYGDSSRFTITQDSISVELVNGATSSSSSRLVASQATWTDGATPTIRLTVNDITIGGETNFVVKFKISDPFNKATDEIKISTVVKRSQPTVSSALTTQLDSYRSLIPVGDNDPEGEVTDITLVSTERSNVLITDSEASAQSVNYSVKVYAMGTVTNNRFSALPLSTALNDSTMLLGTYNASTDVFTYSNLDGAGDPLKDLINYVNNYFTISISDKGRAVSLTPVSVLTTAVPIAFATFKHTDVPDGTEFVADGTTTKLESVGTAFVNVTVRNSLPYATEASGVNEGHFTSQDGESGFLTFSGYAYSALRTNETALNAGIDETDSEEEKAAKREENEANIKAYSQRDYQIFDTENPGLGLFGDYDIANNKAPVDKITYEKYEVLTSYTDPSSKETKQTMKDALSTASPILNVTHKDGVLSILINRKVVGSVSDLTQGQDDYYYVPIRVYAYDVASTRTNLIYNDILVRVNNSEPTFVTSGSTDDYTITSEIASDGSTISYLDASIEYGRSLTIQMDNIISDYDIQRGTTVYNPEQFKFVSVTGRESQSLDGISLKADANHVVLSDDDTSRAELFRARTVTANNSVDYTTNRSIVIECISRRRGATGTIALQVRDSCINGTSNLMYIRLTVKNTAPVQVADVSSRTITILGKKYIEPDENSSGDIMGDAYTFNVLDYVTDANEYDAVNKIENPTSPSNTYIYIESFENITTGEYYDVYGDGVTANQDPEGGETEASSMIYASWDDTDYHQSFFVQSYSGVFGTQELVLTVRDSGYNEGATSGVTDGIYSEVHLIVKVARPVDDFVPSVVPVAQNVSRNITPEVLLNTSGADRNSDGYEIVDMTTSATTVEIVRPQVAESADTGLGGWKILGKIPGEQEVDINVTFKVGDITLKPITFKILVVGNTMPTLRGEPFLLDGKHTITAAQLTGEKMYYVTPEQLFYDPDIDDMLTLVAPVKSDAEVICEPYIDNNTLALKFNARGDVKITFSVMDSMNTPKSFTVVFNCADFNELTFFNSIVAKFQREPIMYWSIFGGAILLILLAIIIPCVVVHKRKLRMQLELLLSAETSQEQELLKLTGSGAAGNGLYIGNAQVNNPAPMLNASPQEPNTVILDNRMLPQGNGNDPDDTPPSDDNF